MKIDIQKRYSFKYYDSLIAYMIDNHFELEHGELWHIFHNMYETKFSKYNKLGCAIIFLLDELKGEKRDRLVDLLNECFEYKLLINEYVYKCKNELIADYLIKLEKQLRKEQEQIQENYESFENFKSLF